MLRNVTGKHCDFSLFIMNRLIEKNSLCKLSAEELAGLVANDRTSFIGVDCSYLYANGLHDSLSALLLVAPKYAHFAFKVNASPSLWWVSWASATHGSNFPALYDRTSAVTEIFQMNTTRRQKNIASLTLSNDMYAVRYLSMTFWKVLPKLSCMDYLMKGCVEYVLKLL